ncbi:hypothetical protein [Pedobacter nutrimenti]|uniref:hypothetical protein n=1 Tax=Pedobacter nutrimenti TaxID=1241337 RepID=UPI00292ED847|nr:hypothetical protein [Pedobacter nutrimenti]
MKVHIITYICVYNYGAWRHLFYGKISADGKSAKFNNMAKDMAYHIAIPHNESYKLIEKPFILDSAGVIVFSKPDWKHTGDLILQKINTLPLKKIW